MKIGFPSIHIPFFTGLQEKELPKDKVNRLYNECRAIKPEALGKLPERPNAKVKAFVQLNKDFTTKIKRCENIKGLLISGSLAHVAYMTNLVM